ncbi:MAG: hypothetical protein C4523_16840 [Myxococcales bacterium]|nr:MAG: hypothetical protein C4523_16840 [Myxococcales bacterium]
MLNEHPLLKYLRPIRAGRPFAGHFVLDSIEGWENVQLQLRDLSTEEMYALQIFLKESSPSQCLLFFSLDSTKTYSHDVELVINAIKTIIRKNTAHLSDWELRGLFNSYAFDIPQVRDVEFWAVLKGLKPAQRTEIEPSKYPRLKEIYEKNGVYIDCSSFVFGYRQDMMEKLSADAPGALIQYYASKDKRKVALLKDQEGFQFSNLLTEEVAKPYSQVIAEAIKTHGQLLGYPLCCIEAFQKVEHHATPRIFFETFRNTTAGARAELNNLEGEMNFISHFPCSFNCAPSLQYVRSLLDAFPLSDRLEAHRGFYLYFINGGFIKLKVDRSTNPWAYRLIKASDGNCKGSLKEEPCATVYKHILEGDSLLALDRIEIYKKGSRICSIGNKLIDWIAVEFE